MVVDLYRVVDLSVSGDTLCHSASAGRGGELIIMHGRSRMNIDPRIPTMPGRSTSGFHRPGGHRLHQSRSAVRCSASRMKGELHPTKNRL